MASWSEWFKAAHKRNISLEDSLPINLSSDLKRLYSSGLPTYDLLIIDGENYCSSRQKIMGFCRKHDRTWVRVYNKSDKDKRYSKFDLRGYRKVADFIEDLNIDIKKFDIQLFEFCTNKFGGNILTNQDGTVIEIAEGTQDIVGKCLGPFFCGSISSLGSLRFRESNFTEEIRRAAWRTLQHVKLTRGEYIPGYFEFIVSDNDKVYFLDYKANIK